jgi:HTH-type transcriptional regulator / antitoxin MqsA
MQCITCGTFQMARECRDIPYAYKGESTVIPAVNGQYCTVCGEAVMDAEESQRVSLAMLAFNKQVNSSVVDPSFISNVRKKLALDQQEAAEIFGGGVNAFSRYETGKTRPPLALVKLLKLLEIHPELLQEVKTI